VIRRRRRVEGAHRIAYIGSPVADGGHLPVNHSEDPAFRRVKDDVVEFEVAVADGGGVWRHAPPQNRGHFLTHAVHAINTGDTGMAGCLEFGDDRNFRGRIALGFAHCAQGAGLTLEISWDRLIGVEIA